MRTRPSFTKTASIFAKRSAVQTEREAQIAAGTLKCSCHGCQSPTCSITGHVAGCLCTEWDPEWDK